MRRYPPRGQRSRSSGLNTTRPEPTLEFPELAPPEDVKPIPDDADGPKDLSVEPSRHSEEGENLYTSTSSVTELPGPVSEGQSQWQQGWRPGGGTWPPDGWPPGSPPTGPVQLATAYVPWQVYNGYVRPPNLPAPGTIFPELARTPPLYKKPPK